MHSGQITLLEPLVVLIGRHEDCFVKSLGIHLAKLCVGHLGRAVLVVFVVELA